MPVAGCVPNMSVFGYLGFRQVSCQEGTRIWPGQFNSMADSSSTKTVFFLYLTQCRLHRSPFNPPPTPLNYGGPQGLEKKQTQNTIKFSAYVK